MRAAILTFKSPVLTQNLREPFPAGEAAIPVGVKGDRDAGTVVRMRYLKLRSLGEEFVPAFAFLGAEGKLYLRIREHRGNRSWSSRKRQCTGVQLTELTTSLRLWLRRVTVQHSSCSKR